MNIPVVAIVGFSDSGKTTAAMALVRILSQRGYHIAVIKHAHEGHDVGPALKDSDKLFAAGAAVVIASSPGQITATERVEGDTPLEAIVVSLHSEYDLAIAEGFKSSSVPKVLVTRQGVPTPTVDGVIACVADGPVQGLPVFTPLQMEALADFLLERLIKAAGVVPSY